ncbi:hypothetical protein EYF80_025814 [Liparis tanakae]|uniref:Uncharacterized protein n=1 Tax=Liparis tanakae TaxID=230148 RepID=A0A4Z2HGK9_9TELE|nr:hypothetical protein EYF80_025814 [Liparis tanakae]
MAYRLRGFVLDTSTTERAYPITAMQASGSFCRQPPTGWRPDGHMRGRRRSRYIHRHRRPTSRSDRTSKGTMEIGYVSERFPVADRQRLNSSSPLRRIRTSHKAEEQRREASEAMFYSPTMGKRRGFIPSV